MKNLGKEYEMEIINDWIPITRNHLYWSATSTRDENGQVILAKFKAFLGHIVNKHQGVFLHVDLSPLNKFYRRETFASESPFHLARHIPQNTWKTVTDAWNGYHSIPLRESGRPLTTFITPFGR